MNARGMLLKPELHLRVRNDLKTQTRRVIKDFWLTEYLDPENPREIPMVENEKQRCLLPSDKLVSLRVSR